MWEFHVPVWLGLGKPYPSKNDDFLQLQIFLYIKALFDREKMSRDSNIDTKKMQKITCHPRLAPLMSFLIFSIEQIPEPDELRPCRLSLQFKRQI